MSEHLHNDTNLYYITFFLERYISKTRSLLLTDTSHSPCNQYNYLDNYSLSPFHGYYYMQRNTTNIFNSCMWLIRQHLHGFINLRPPLKFSQKYFHVALTRSAYNYRAEKCIYSWEIFAVLSKTMKTQKFSPANLSTFTVSQISFFRYFWLYNNIAIDIVLLLKDDK